MAALTTSIPEAPESGRNWDYRYCWLRDAYFVVHALNRLGATRTMEGYLSYITNLVASADGGLQPVYGIGLESRARREPGGIPRGLPRPWGRSGSATRPTSTCRTTSTAASCSRRPSRSSTSRLLHPGGPRLFELLEGMGRHALALLERARRGPLGVPQPCQRAYLLVGHVLGRVRSPGAASAARLGENERAGRWRDGADRIRDEILESAWNPKRRSFAHELGGEDVDATLLLLHELGFVAADDPRFVATVAAVESELRQGPYLFRYRKPDDFGAPRTAFNICTFWYIDALAAIGRRDEARELFENMLAQRNSAGFLSEDLDPGTGEPWGNFPQTYSMVGLINSAMRLSRSWEEAF